MALLVRDALHYYQDLMQNKSDPRVEAWPLMSSPWPTVASCLCYAVLALLVGPWLMRDRKPLHLRPLLVAYNSAQVIVSIWILYEGLMGGWLHHYSFRCQPVDYSTKPLAMRMAKLVWWYYFSKYTEFFDTMFLILRKRKEEITALHLIHHATTPITSWFVVKFAAGGHATLFIVLSAFTHILMYTYFLLVALGPRFRKFTWWKEYATPLPLVQFLVIMVHSFQPLLTECDYPRVFACAVGLHAALFLALFSLYYRKIGKTEADSEQDTMSEHHKAE